MGANAFVPVGNPGGGLPSRLHCVSRRSLVLPRAIDFGQEPARGGKHGRASMETEEITALINLDIVYSSGVVGPWELGKSLTSGIDFDRFDPGGFWSNI